jgi:hypothetical protein
MLWHGEAMAQIQRKDRRLGSELDALERQIQLVKISYEKYFSGVDRIEPGKEREDLRRTVRELDRARFIALVQRHRYQTLRSRFISLDTYIQRNLFMIERGTHPRFKFRADLAARAGGPPQISDYERRRLAEERTYRDVYDRYLEARRVSGQHTEVDYDRVRSAIRRQVKQIQSRFKCSSVKFRVQVENGVARIKAVPQK